MRPRSLGWSHAFAHSKMLNADAEQRPYSSARSRILYEIPMDSHRPGAVASRGEQAARTHEGTDSHKLAVTARAHRPSDPPAAQHARLAITATGRRERPGG